jgi:hypothetical protein
MSKNSIMLAPDLRPQRPGTRLLPSAVICLLAALLVPLLMEGVVLCYSRWCEVLGTSVDVRTPVLDSIGDHLQDAREAVWNTVAPQFQKVPWNPKVVLPIAAVIMALAMMMLRR